MYDPKKVNEIRIRRIDSIPEKDRKFVEDKAKEIPGYIGFVVIELNAKGETINIKPIQGRPSDEFRRVMKGIEVAVF